MFVEDAVQVLGIDGILEVSSIDIGHAVCLDLCLIRRYIVVVLVCKLRVDDDRIELAVLAAYGKLCVGCLRVEIDDVAFVEHLERVTEHDLQRTSYYDVDLLSAVSNELIRRIQSLIGVGEDDAVRLAHLVLES